MKTSYLAFHFSTQMPSVEITPDQRRRIERLHRQLNRGPQDRVIDGPLLNDLLANLEAFYRIVSRARDDEKQ